MAAKKKTTKATASKKVRAPKVKETSVTSFSDMDVMDMSETNESSKRFSLITKRNIVIVLLLASFGYLLFLNRGLFVAAMVNNQPISRLSVVSELEKKQGKSALDSLITETLIMQEAQKNNIVVSQEEVDGEIGKISDSVKAQGQDLDQLLTLQGMKKEDLEKQVRVQKIVEKILADKLNVTDEDVKKYITDNKDSFPATMKEEEKVTQARTQLQQDKIGTEFQTWVTDLRSKSDIKYFVSY